MRIDRIDIIHVKNPFLHPFETSFTRFVERDAPDHQGLFGGSHRLRRVQSLYGPLYNPEDNGTCFHIIKNIIAPVILHQDIQDPFDFMRKMAFIRGNRLAIAAVKMRSGSCIPRGRASR